MSFKDIRARKAADRRHRQLLRAANDVVSRRSLAGTIDDIDPAEIVAIAFGRHELRIDVDEALDYLNAILAERGFPLRYATAEAGEGR
ncbi:hypothetical protein DMH25_08205 [Streptomyces sp. WAC 01325]|uniref:hypothetical protein n=1 Tax=Streptomyces sp. WAC 01325 TaxID=2203202 RepID=UPI000F87C033|nr:hypothetical protein [Streptomyces sp. WAC 01325]RSN13762.1 hypothetical protein DMH25_08205 [Streptomyces sp. WAC 01325]